MRPLLIILLLLATKLNAQTALKFDKRFVQCEDKWVAFPMGKDSTYKYGFIYIDAQAGLTLNYEGQFMIAATGEYLPHKLDSTSLKIRLQANNVVVAHIPEHRFRELKIDAVPDWLRHYKTDTGTVERLYKWGYIYNGWHECEKALGFLLKAQAKDANYTGLAVELAFSYNCLNECDKALEILGVALKLDPTSAYVHKEMIYTLIQKKDIDKAVEHYFETLKLNVENTYHAENSFNILGYYYKQKDSKNAKVWLKEVKKWPNTNEQLTTYVADIKKDMKNW